MNNINKLSEQVILILGDMMVDRYILGSVDRISPEAPVPVLCQKQIIHKLGGTGNVIANAASLGAKVRAIGRIGNDSEGLFFRESLQKMGVDDSCVFTEGKTITKTRISAANQQFIRIDEEEITSPSTAILEKILVKIDEIFHGVTVVLISDYAKGFVTEEISQLLIRTARSKCIPVLVDPKGKTAAKYRGATALSPNNKEFLDLTGFSALPSEEEITNQGLKLCRENDLQYLIFTRSEKGISLIDLAAGTKTDYPTEVKEVIDVTGAGDTVVATVALAMAAGFKLNTCMKIANIAASIVISKYGATQTTIAELNRTLQPGSASNLDIETILSKIHHLQKQGKKIVFTNGCFDLVHAGHISSFIQARSLGDILVVGVNSDDSIRHIKGAKRPIITLEDRVKLLSALSCVDFVIPFEEDTPQTLIEKVRPDVLVKGKDWEGKRIAGDEFVWSYGGKVAFLNLEQGLSTTSIIEKIRKLDEP